MLFETDSNTDMCKKQSTKQAAATVAGSRRRDRTIHPRRGLARILHEAFTCARRKHGIFGSIVEIRTQMYFRTIWPQDSRTDFALQARIFRTSTTLATKFHAICGLGTKLRKPLPLIIGSVLLVLASSLGCNRTEQALRNRIAVALPQWFYPSEDRPWLEKAWKTIREQNPGWVIDLDLVPGRTEQILQKLMVVHASGEKPDLACVRLEWMPALVERGILQPVDRRFLAKAWETLIPSLLPCVEWQGNRYVLPYDVGVRVILYRTDLFEAAGIPDPSPAWTWDDLVVRAKRLTQDLDGDGTIDRWGFGIPAARSRKSILQWLPWFWSLGGDLQTAGGKVTLSCPAAVKAMQWYRDLAHRYQVTPPTFYSIDQDAIFQGLASGLFAMTEGGSWEIAMLAKHSPYHDKIHIALLPTPRPGDPSFTLVDGWGFAILADAEQKRPVLARLLEELCSTEHQLDKYRASGMLSPFQPVYQEPLFTEDRRGKVLVEALDRSRPALCVSSFPVVSEALEIAMQEVLMDGVRPSVALAAQDQLLRNRQNRNRRPRPMTSGHDDPDTSSLPAGVADPHRPGHGLNQVKKDEAT